MKNKIIIFRDDMHIGGKIEVSSGEVLISVVHEESRPVLDKTLSMIEAEKLVIRKETTQDDGSIVTWFEPVSFSSAAFSEAVVESLKAFGAYALSTGPALADLFEFFDAIQMSAEDRAKLIAEISLLSEDEATHLLEEKKKHEASK